MNKMDQIDDYVSAELWSCPAVAGGDEGLSALVMILVFYRSRCQFNRATLVAHCLVVTVLWLG
tara:strand:- start:642 stop:830 length:189 start_codon:yes stop_codon:yes gene_type:complete